MKQKTIVTISGIRPDFVRMSEIFRKLDDEFNHILIHSGQHIDSSLSDVFFRDLNIRQPDFNLEIGGTGKYHYHQLAELSVKLIELLKNKNLKPDVVMFLGDSNSVLGSIVLKKEGYRVAHIEAGMRSYDSRMLEESNRVICDHMSDFLFVYHENYKNNLLKENISPDKIFVVGNTIVEVAKKWLPKVGPRTHEHILVDIHRPENFLNPDRIRAIISYIDEISRVSEKPVFWLNFPRTMNEMVSKGIELPTSFSVIPLMGYIDFLTMQRRSFCIVSDSGTAQEEPALLDVPVLVPRDFTERWESVQCGNSLMVDVGRPRSEAAQEGISFVRNFPTPADVAWMGEGKTADLIVKTLAERL